MERKNTVLNYLTEILLVLNLLGVLYLALRIAAREVPDNRELNLEIFEKQKKLSREMVVLKENLEVYHTVIVKEMHQWKEERQKLEKLVERSAKSQNVHHLFLNDRFEQIFDLQKQGLSVEQIAKKLDKGTGEVSFILELAKQTLKGEVIK
ncbi:hypothetical protein V7111_02645 [Neobacillus niacini]|uniref:DUF6115 domain-containing protein n=1 Tax=Neobacillus niacini TaxID=86668 RepID=UPI002FFFD877